MSGVFDILHYGHVDFLKRAKELVGNNGRLIVAVHDDKSVREHKGISRPINKAAYRIKMLEAIRYIDEVTLWHGWENITELVDKIRPDYIAVSGEEYSKKNIKEYASNHGIKFMVFPKQEGISTTILVNKINKN